MGAGKKLQEFLRNKNISVTALSRETGISSNTLYAIIKRDSNISTEIMSKISDSLKISMDELTKMLSDNKKETMDTEPIFSESRIVDVMIEADTTNTEELIYKLNALTAAYEAALEKLYDLQAELEKKYMEKEFINRAIQLQLTKIHSLQNDIQNRKVELELIRNKISLQQKNDIEAKEDVPKRNE